MLQNITDFINLTYFTTLLYFILYSPDVKAFLLMEKMQNLSDASEDEDDKVSSRLTNFEGILFVCCFHLFCCFTADSIFSVHVLDNPNIKD